MGSWVHPELPPRAPSEDVERVGKVRGALHYSKGIPPFRPKPVSENQAGHRTVLLTGHVICYSSHRVPVLGWKVLDGSSEDTWSQDI